MSPLVTKDGSATSRILLCGSRRRFAARPAYNLHAAPTPAQKLGTAPFPDHQRLFHGREEPYTTVVWLQCPISTRHIYSSAVPTHPQFRLIPRAVDFRHVRVSNPRPEIHRRSHRGERVPAAPAFSTSSSIPIRLTPLTRQLIHPMGRSQPPPSPLSITMPQALHAARKSARPARGDDTACLLAPIIHRGAQSNTSLALSSFPVQKTSSARGSQ